MLVENLKFKGYYKGRRGQGGREGTKPISKFCLGVDKNVIPGMHLNMAIYGLRLMASVLGIGTWFLNKSLLFEHIL